MNPYWGKDFFGFLALFATRIGKFLTGGLSFQELASDEIQILVLILVALSTALVGTFLVLKQMAMLANSISHTVLFGITIAFLVTLAFSEEAKMITMTTLLIASLITGVITSLLTQLLTHLVGLQEDASIGLVFTTLFALGVVLVTLYTRNAHIGVEAVMGNVDALHPNDLKLVFWVTLGNFACVLLFYKEYKITAFDSPLARSLGISPAFFNYLLMVQTSATVIGAFRSIGVLLVLAFLVGPVLAARLLVVRLGTLIWLSCGLGVLASVMGVAFSRHFLSVYEVPLSTGGLVVTLIALIYLLLLTQHRISLAWTKRRLQS
jgi:manganese/zinc/iron transport system permease protein